MTQVEFTLQGRSGSRRDLLVDGDPASTWTTALAGLVDPDTRVFRGQDPVTDDAILASGQIRSGDVIQAGGPGGGRTPWPLTSPTLAVVAGPDAGRVIPLGEGETLVGRDPSAGIVLADPSVSTRHARLEVHAGTVTVTDLGSTNGIWTDLTRLPAHTATPWPAGTRLVLGEVAALLLGPSGPDGTVLVDSDGSRQFNRITRYLPSAPNDRVIIPDPGTDEPHESSSWVQYVTSGAMLAAGVTTAVMFRNPLYAVLGVVAPAATMLATFTGHASQRRRRRARASQQAAAHAAAVTALQHAAQQQVDHAWQVSLDPARAALAMVGPTSDLWSTDAAAPHALTVHLGTRELTAAVLAGEQATTNAPVLRAAPVSVDLRSVGVLGIAGAASRTAAAVRAMLLQLAAGRSPADLAVVHVADEANAHSWSWLRWLPHTHTLLGPVASVSPTARAAAARLDELSELITQRQALTGPGSTTQLLLPQVVVVLDGAGAMRRNPAVVDLLQNGPAVGVYTIAVDDRASLLPAEATARLTIDGRGVLEVHGAPAVNGILVNQTSLEVADACARAITDLTPLGGEQAGLPDQVRLVDLLETTQPDEQTILSHWHAGQEGQVTLGVDDTGHLSVVDLLRHGPHAVVAGVTGAGKSELLRTFLIGLALSAPPDELNLLLIDFKGGGAFGKLTDLPHVVAYADDSTIAGVLAQRLLDSLEAELDRRKELFRVAGNAEDLLTYRRARQRRMDLDPVARLVIVVDEFAELKEAQPDFIDGLVKVARIGRSLGVHLVLATQQPNQITGQIRDNSNLRICLRVLEPATSLDLLGSPAAAYFPNRIKGRAAWAGGDSPVTVIQTARVSTPRRDPNAPVPPPTLTILPWSACGLNGQTQPRAEDSAGDTDMTALAQLMRDVAEAEGITTTHQPWVPPVPDRVQMVTSAATIPTAVIFGIQDRPARQRHEPLVFDLTRGNLGIVGGHSSGRSTALRTLAGALASQFSADDLHLYVVDHQPAPALRALGRLPHCGVVVTRTDRFATGRLVTRLRMEQQSRTEQIARTGAASFTELRASGQDAPPWIVVLVDGWETVEDQNVVDGLLRLAEDGPAVGIDLVVTTGTDPRRLYSTLTDVLVLRFDQRDMMAGFGVPIARIPATLPPGRAFRSGSADAIQIALLPADPSPDAQSAAITTLAASLRPPLHHQPMRVVELPRRITVHEPRLAEHLAHLTGRQVMIAVGGDDASARTVDLDRSRLLVIAGPAATGRTQALVTIAEQLTGHGVPVHVWNVRDDDRDRFPTPTHFDDHTPPEESVVLVDDAHLIPSSDEAMSTVLTQDSVAVVIAGDTPGLSGVLGWKNRLTGATTVLLSPRGSDLTMMSVAGEPFTAGPGGAYLSARGRTERVQLLCTT